MKQTASGAVAPGPVLLLFFSLLQPPTRDLAPRVTVALAAAAGSEGALVLQAPAVAVSGLNLEPLRLAETIRMIMLLMEVRASLRITEDTTHRPQD